MRNICSAYLNSGSAIIIVEADCWVSIFVSFSSIERSGVPLLFVDLLNIHPGVYKIVEQLPFSLFLFLFTNFCCRTWVRLWLLLAHVIGTWASLSNAARITVQKSRHQVHRLRGCLMKAIPDLCLKPASSQGEPDWSRNSPANWSPLSWVKPS